MRDAGHFEENPLQRLRVRLLGLLPGCQQSVLRHARSILYFSKDLPCRCGLGNLAQRSGREVPEKRCSRKLASRPPASEASYRNQDFSCATQDHSLMSRHSTARRWPVASIVQHSRPSRGATGKAIVPRGSQGPQWRWRDSAGRWGEERPANLNRHAISTHRTRGRKLDLRMR